MMMLYCILFGLVLASSYCRADLGKRYPTVSYNSKLQLRDHDYLRLQFMGAKDGWLGCPADSDRVCDLRTCPSRQNYYTYFNGEICWGEVFQIISDGTQSSPIKSGQRIRLRYPREHNTWMSCWDNRYCDKRTCPGTTTQASNFGRCGGEIFKIYAYGRAIGHTIYNGDLVMLYYDHGGRYVSIQGEYQGDNTSTDFCPALAPPTDYSYTICSKNVFRVYRKP